MLLLGNLGVAQLLRGYGAVEALEAVDAVGGDGIALHTNPLQEALQPGGDADFAERVVRLREVLPAVGVPVLLKEVGHGISGAVAESVAAAVPGTPLVASGGVRSGLQIAKAIALGARVAAVARPLLAPALESADPVAAVLERFVFELKVAMHRCGARDVGELASTPLSDRGPNRDA